MGYYLQALIAKSPLIRNNTDKCEKAHVVQLKQGFEMLLVNEEILPQLSTDDEGCESLVAPFSMLTSGFAEWSRRLSHGQPVTYVEAEYFGGVGNQVSIVWHGGLEQSPPMAAEIGPINEALKIIGVKATDSKDEFETIGLDRHRDVDDWIRESKNAV